MFGPPLLLAQGASVRHYVVLADYKEYDSVWCASPIFMLIPYYLGFTNRKRKYFEEKTTATFKSKQTSIDPKLSSNTSQLLDIPHFLEVNTFK
jgi:hypothetical protein